MAQNDDLLIVAYYTNPEYEREADRLEASVRELGLDYWIHPEIMDGADWETAVRHKPTFLMDARNAFDVPLLYVDVDAVFHADPRPMLDKLPACDIGIHCFRASWISGTLYLPAKDTTATFLRTWADADKTSPDVPPAGFNVQPQRVMAHLADSDLWKVARLPAELCWIFDATPQWLDDPSRRPVIEHLQASREYRGGRVDKVAVDRRRERVAAIEGGP